MSMMTVDPRISFSGWFMVFSLRVVCGSAKQTEDLTRPQQRGICVIRAEIVRRPVCVQREFVPRRADTAEHQSVVRGLVVCRKAVRNADAGGLPSHAPGLGGRSFRFGLFTCHGAG